MAIKISKINIMRKPIITLTAAALLAFGCGQSGKKRAENGAAENTVLESAAVAQNFQENGETKRSAPSNLDSIDISSLLGKETEFLGMIGDDIQRMGIVFVSTSRISETGYEVVGKSKVKNNVCDFRGVMEAQSAMKADFGNDEINTVDGRITGKYCFYEDKNQPGTGVFEGTFDIYWAHYDDETGIADIFYTYSKYNVLFDGIWKSYQTGAVKRACWSDYKACFPDGFDCSDGPDLIPDEKYRSAGWFEADIFSSDDEKRERAEKERRDNWVEWWK
jgi:hypothetical protein